MSEAPGSIEDLHEPSTKEVLAREIKEKMKGLIKPSLDFAGYDDKTGNRLIIILDDKPTDPNNPESKTEQVMEIYVGDRSELKRLRVSQDLGDGRTTYRDGYTDYYAAAAEGDDTTRAYFIRVDELPDGKTARLISKTVPGPVATTEVPEKEMYHLENILTRSRPENLDQETRDSIVVFPTEFKLTS